ncbi:Methylmalonyl-CoA epimerase, mitochondrial [Amphibalanus amphitrite]|uniref:Methylmalonyl-CoA epimerase, mitochondrial n=1 Tax=Amphibalanus amphitrite TaxID=1232801 RepID=A0A6A4WF86_AMPAM|nr:methylmalonyl-CoA epimerase, mitochondrial-like [Amphibalanus amphitrite]XP_043217379.1 methylmalonyl-CoA epimerase, mitochondrial-like [Amphibalanus amphitrite]XP_043217380.1 methylmalonyl-CoA epimerase, mitochondrial-like [Amphibalanus amphitrite]XP_043217381.1 methylmalonyl-CoA epimerase, mitochondrial-like [Amphibalanus amphitrite]XP_043217382.1 methylmalonyl-CoA epimerase, mitochondrial-like [Amphibalanus amphitrite]XP_043217383.1 methylmalonyl-CoA epimerase, mitochondrial-like [Amphib
MALQLGTTGWWRLAARLARGRVGAVTRSAHGDAADNGVPKALWKLGRLNHVAIATPDLKKSTALFRDVLGADVSEPEALPEHGVRTVFINLGNTKLELLHPLGPDSPITNFLDKNPSGGMHHICIEVDNIAEAVASLQQKQIRCLNEPRPGAHGKPVVFLHPKDCAGVLVELEEA